MLRLLQNQRFGHRAGVAVITAVTAMSATAFADTIFQGFIRGDLVVSRSVYLGNPGAVAVGQPLPPHCPPTAVCRGKGAINDGTYPGVWNNASVDGSFGVSSPIFLDEITTGGLRINTFPIPTDMAVASFSSTSELALNLSPDGDVLTFIGYHAPVNAIDVSNSNTPALVDPSNPVGDSYPRTVLQVYSSGAIERTDVNAFSGNNGRDAILEGGYIYMAGNSNNSPGTPIADIVSAGGVQMALPGQSPLWAPTQVGFFAVTQVNDPATGQPYPIDKVGKDNNFRGLTLFDNTLYVTKGSGSNGINSVYEIGTPGLLPTFTSATSEPINILSGFPVTLADQPNATHPFGLWFADANTLYVSDEGDGDASHAATSQSAGLQKWVRAKGAKGVWRLAYVMQNGLNLGQPYSVPDFPASLNPATDGLRNITGRNNGDGTVTIWAVTSTISAAADSGADPNKLVSITDVLSNTDPALASYEPFMTIRSAGFGEVLRGVSFTPGTVASHHGRK